MKEKLNMFKIVQNVYLFLKYLKKCEIEQFIKITKSDQNYTDRSYIWKTQIIKITIRFEIQIWR